MKHFAKFMSDQQLIDVIISSDNLEKPYSRRFIGDDDAIVNLMEKLGCRQLLADKLLILGEVLRECVSRGIQIPRSN
jgi:hypothetical protein